MGFRLMVDGATSNSPENQKNKLMNH